MPNEKILKSIQGAISYFRQSYIKTGLFRNEFSEIIGTAFLIRNQSDYEDFFILSKEEAKLQCENALCFYNAVETFVEQKIGRNNQ